MLYVQKYGGTSLADAGRIRIAARRSAELARQGHRVVVVVSAQGDTTDEMIEKVVEGVKAKITMDKVGDALGALGGLFGKK